MTKEKAEKILPVLQAIISGQKIQVNINNRWEDVDENHNCAFLPESYEYRIKPESKYRPFANAEECWKEMQKHQPFGWIKNGGYRYNIITTGVMSVKIIDTRGAITTLYFSDLLAHYRFSDGTPFGVKTEEG